MPIDVGDMVVLMDGTDAVVVGIDNRRVQVDKFGVYSPAWVKRDDIVAVNPPAGFRPRRDLMKFFAVIFAMVLVSCGAGTPDVDNATKCNLGCAIAGAQLTEEKCSDLCDAVKGSRIGRSVCESTCIEALEAGKDQCVDVCLEAI